MDRERLQLVHGLNDVELAVLLCLVARRHCILTAANATTAAAAGDVATAAVEGLQAEVETVCPLHASRFGLGIGAYMWLIRASDGSADCSADIRPACGHGPLPARYHARRARWWPARQRGRHWHGYCHLRRCNRDDQTDALRFAAAVCRCLTPPPSPLRICCAKGWRADWRSQWSPTRAGAATRVRRHARQRRRRRLSRIRSPARAAASAASASPTWLCCAGSRRQGCTCRRWSWKSVHPPSPMSRRLTDKAHAHTARGH